MSGIYFLGTIGTTMVMVATVAMCKNINETNKLTLFLPRGAPNMKCLFTQGVYYTILIEELRTDLNPL